MRKYLFLTSIYFLFITSFVFPQSEDFVVAVVNGKQITQKDIDNFIVGKLRPLQEQISILRRNALENLIIQSLLEEEAKKQGITIEELRRKFTMGNVEVLQSRVEREYLENISAFVSMNPHEAKERLRLDLESRERVKLYRNAVEKLKAEAQIEIKKSTASSNTFEVNNQGVFIGKKESPLVIVLFSDFQCPFCREFYGILKQLLETHGDKVKIVFKHLPLEIHSRAFYASQASVCAEKQGKFWEYHDILFTSNDFSDKRLNKYAESIGLNMVDFRKCQDSEESRFQVLKDMQEAKRLGIEATPSFLVNGMLYQGTVDLNVLIKIIEKENAKH